MSESTEAIVIDGVLVNVIVATHEVALQMLDAGVFGPRSSIVDLDHTDPMPGIGWHRTGTTWVPPQLPTTPTGPPMPREEEQVIGTIKTIDPLVVTLPKYGDQPAQRHGGYTPMTGDRVQVTYTGGHWVVQDKVL